MQLQHVKGALRGLSIDTPVSGLTVVSGPNGSGKSTLLSLASLVLQAQRPSDHPDGFTVEASWGEDGVWIRRVIAGGTHTLQSNLPSATGLKATQAAIEKAVGDAWLWDTAAFLALSPAKRTAMLESHQLLRLDDSLQVATLMLEGQGVDLDALLAVVPSSYLRQRSAQAGLETLVQDCGQAWRDANAAHKQIKAAADRAAVVVEAADLPSGTVALWEAKVQEASDKLAELRAKTTAAEAEGRARGAMRRELEQLDRELAKGLLLTQGLERREKELEELAGRDEALASALTSTSQKVEELNARRTANEAELANQERTLQGLRGRWATAAATQKAWAHLAPVLDPLTRVAAHAPLQGPDDAAWLADLNAALLALQQLGRPEEQPDTIKATADEVTKILDGLRSKRDALHAAHQRAMLAAGEARTAVALHSEKHKSMEADIQDHRGRLEAARAEAPAQRERQAALREELAQGGAQDASMDALRQSAEADLERARECVHRLSEVAALRASAASQLADLQAITSRREFITAQKKLVQAAQGAYLQAAAEPLLDVAAPLVEAVLEMPLGIDIAEGTRVLLGGNTIEHRSNSEQIVAGLGLHVAAVSKLPGWKCVIVDNAETIEAPRRAKLYHHLADLVERGVIDNVLLALVGDGALDLDDDRIHHIHMRRHP